MRKFVGALINHPVYVFYLLLSLCTLFLTIAAIVNIGILVLKFLKLQISEIIWHSNHFSILILAFESARYKLYSSNTNRWFLIKIKFLFQPLFKSKTLFYKHPSVENPIIWIRFSRSNLHNLTGYSIFTLEFNRSIRQFWPTLNFHFFFFLYFLVALW